MTVPAQLNVPTGAALVAVCAAAAYAGALALGFAYDDVVIIAGNERVHDIGNALRIFGWPYWGGADLGIYRPLTSLTFLLDWVVSSGSPAWFHFANVVWNALASALAFLLLAEIFALPAALAGGLLFALHPVHVEAVANVVGRAEMISAALMLAACIVWIRRTDTGARQLALVGVLFALALLAKESAVMLPALLVLLDFVRGRWQLARNAVRAYAAREAALVVVCTVVLAAYVALRLVVLGRFGPATLDPALEGSTHRALTALQAWPHYLRLAVFPRTLLADYGPRIIMPATGWTASAALGAAILFGLLLGAVAAARRDARRTAFVLLWFPLTILPVSNLVVPIGIVVAERTLYLPMLAAAAGAAAAVEYAWRSRARAHALIVSAVGIILVLFAARIVTRVPEWSSTDSIFAALMRDRPDSFRAHWHFGRVARAAGDITLAQRRYTEALRLWPVREGLVAEAAAIAVMQQRLRDGRSLAEFGTQRWPHNLPLQRLLAATSLDLGDTLTARRALRAGLALAPDDAMLKRMSAALQPRVEAAGAH